MMGFQKIGDAFYERRFEEPDCAVRVDLKAKRIQYPAELSIERETILNFSKPENFVVLNCVCRLLEKGYTPECIVLEQGGVGGHGLSTAYLDILVKDKNGDPYLLIECKTPGAEFKRAWDKTLLDGGQLFNYFNSFLKAQFLCLYTVEEKEDKLIDPTLPVIGIPVKSSTLDGLDALLATVQMPKGIPVATVAIDGADNAALLAVQMLALSDDRLAQALLEMKKDMAEGVAKKDAALQEKVAAL